LHLAIDRHARIFPTEQNRIATAKRIKAVACGLEAQISGYGPPSGQSNSVLVRLPDLARASFHTCAAHP
jgi:hypothetical protein